MLSPVFAYLVFSVPTYVFSESFPENARLKRGDIDLQACLDNFNVHKDKIIRTQDSQNMGAKYLNEIDLGSREECLRLCCETDDCDVFVFEEKNSGSCYLFHCGPPEDFKCKFTHHVNYSSGVLSVNRHLPDLESQIKLTKHEQDLTKLRTADSDSAILKSNIPEQRITSTTTTVSISSKELVPLPKNYEDVTDRKCSRFQFECRSTGECIAIYNACDGIPQCADGSDEGAELGCPGSITTVPPLAPPLAPLLANMAPVRYNANFQPPTNPLNPNQQDVYLRPVAQREPAQLKAPSAPSADFLRPANDPRVGNLRLQYEHQPQPFAPQVQPQPQWIPQQSHQVPPQISPYEDKNSRIFNHKENGYQVPDGQEIRYNKYKGAMQYLHRALGYVGKGGQAQYPDNVNGRDYNKMGNYYADNGYRQPLQQENWPSGEAPYVQTNSHQEDVQYQGQGKTAYKSKSGQMPNIINENVNPKHVQEKLAHDLKHSKENMEHGSDQPNTVKITKPSHHDRFPDVVAYKLDDANDLEDGIAKTQRGAVLAMSLGLIITFVMAIMIGCRLKMVRRRIKKGGKLYAHDADYLVNGMYL